MPSLLAINIGNTNISIGLFKDDTLINCLRISTKKGAVKRGLSHIYGDCPPNNPPDGIILSSVVPTVTGDLKKTLKDLFNLPVLVVGEDIDPGVKNLYDTPSQVGIDRLINAAAAICLYGYPVIIIDFGTAITVDIISEKGEFSGGVILAGINISLNALSSATALLPPVPDITLPKDLIGTNTIDCMKSGIFYGVSSMIDGLVDKIRTRFGSRVLTVATGGDAEIICPYCKTIDKVDKNLTLHGLRIIFYNIGIYG